MDLIEFWTICSANGIVLSREQIRQMERYAEELIYWNQKINMISRKDEGELFAKHILHSLSVLKFIDIGKKAKCIDIGTGGGLPGIPLKIARPDLDMILMDSIAKKVKMTKMFAQHTGLKKIQAICSRAEIFAEIKENHQSFDYIFSRAVKKIDKVLGWIKNLIKPDGSIIFFKGGELAEERAEAEKNHPEFRITDISINMAGAPWFKEDDKKLVICKKF